MRHWNCIKIESSEKKYYSQVAGGSMGSPLVALCEVDEDGTKTSKGLTLRGQKHFKKKSWWDRGDEAHYEWEYDTVYRFLDKYFGKEIKWNEEIYGATVPSMFASPVEKLAFFAAQYDRYEFFAKICNEENDEKSKEYFANLEYGLDMQVAILSSPAYEDDQAELLDFMKQLAKKMDHYQIGDYVERAVKKKMELMKDGADVYANMSLVGVRTLQRIQHYLSQIVYCISALEAIDKLDKKIAKRMPEIEECFGGKVSKYKDCVKEQKEFQEKCLMLVNTLLGPDDVRGVRQYLEESLKCLKKVQTRGYLDENIKAKIKQLDKQGQMMSQGAFPSPCGVALISLFDQKLCGYYISKMEEEDGGFFSSGSDETIEKEYQSISLKALVLPQDANDLAYVQFYFKSAIKEINEYAFDDKIKELYANLTLLTAGRKATEQDLKAIENVHDLVEQYSYNIAQGKYFDKRSGFFGFNKNSDRAEEARKRATDALQAFDATLTPKTEVGHILFYYYLHSIMHNWSSNGELYQALSGLYKSAKKEFEDAHFSYDTHAEKDITSFMQWSSEISAEGYSMAYVDVTNGKKTASEDYKRYVRVAPVHNETPAAAPSAPKNEGPSLKGALGGMIGDMMSQGMERSPLGSVTRKVASVTPGGEGFFDKILKMLGLKK